MSYIYTDAYGRPYVVSSASSLATTATYVAAAPQQAPWPTSNVSSTVQPMQPTYTPQPYYASAEPGSYASYSRYKDAYSGLASSSKPAAPPTSPYVASGLPTPASSNGFEPFGQERSRVGTTGVRRASEQRRQKDAQFACSTCGATFTARHNLKFHEQSHSGQRTHFCQCGEGFMRSTDLRRHERNTCYLTTGYAR